MAHAVVRRTNEIGIRMALGAERRNIIWMVLKESLVLVGTGTGDWSARLMGRGSIDLQPAFWLEPQRSNYAYHIGNVVDSGGGFGWLSAGPKSIARRSVGGAAIRMMEIADCQLPIADCNSAKLQFSRDTSADGPRSEGNRQLAIGNWK